MPQLFKSPRILNRVFTLLSVSIGVIAGLVIIKSALRRMYDPDLWWHLAAGREMIEKKMFLWTDVFSFTCFGEQWVNFEWLFQIVAYSLYRFAGLDGVYWAKVMFCLSAVALLSVSAYIAGARKVWLLFVTWLGFLVMEHRLFERSELATLNFLPLFVAIVLWARQQNPKRLMVVPWLLLPLMILWVNLHAGFIYGLILIVAYRWGARWAGEDVSFLAFLDRITVLFLVAILINPYGPTLITILLEHLVEMRRYTPLIQEWGASTLQALPFFWLTLLISTSGLIIVWIKNRRAFFFWFPVLSMLAVWGMLSYRNAALFAFAAVPFLGWMSKEDFHPFIERVSPDNRRWIGLGLCALFLVTHLKVLKEPHLSDRVMWRLFPKKACEFIRAESIQGHLYNSYSFGGYLQWALGPERKIYSDGRYLFLPLLYQDYELGKSVSRGLRRSDWPRHLAFWGVDHALVEYLPANVHLVGPSTPPFPLSQLNAMFPRDKWALVFWDDISLIFLKRGSGFDSLIREHEYTSLWPYSREQNRFLLARGDISPSVMAQELKRHDKEVGFTMMGQELEKDLREIMGGKQ